LTTINNYKEINMENKPNPGANKSYAFALNIIKMYKFLMEYSKEYVLSKQLLRSGTAIGALIKEAEHAQSKEDFLNKTNIALKEANETEYWLMLLKDSGYINEEQFTSINNDCKELIRLLISIVKTSNQNLKN
jgi:four helix bundle protein